jgi:hypothetical protein
MANFNLTVTNVGDSALSSVTAGGSFNITGVSFGSGQIGSGNPQALTALINPQYSENIQNANVLVQFQTSIEFILAESAIPVSFSNYEVGVFASVNGGSPLLFAYGYTTLPDNLTAGGTQTFDYVLGIKYSQTAQVTVSLVNTMSVPLHAATHILGASGPGGGIDPLPVATSLLPGLVPTSTNTGAKVLTDTGTVSWQALPAQNIGSPILVNGDFSVQSRSDGTLGGSISGGAAYLLDNWYLNSSASIPHVSATWNEWDGTFTPDAVFKNPKGFVRFSSTQAVSTSSFLDLNTYIEANDLDTAIGYACVPSTLIRCSTANQSLLMYCQSGDGTFLFGNLVTLSSSWQRFSFSLPSSWPAFSHFNRDTLADLAKLGLTLSFRIISTSSGSVPASNNTWTTSTTSGSAWNPFTGSGSTFDIADVRFDANCSSVQNPIFEPQQNTYDRCLRLYEPNITYVGIINNLVGGTTTSIGSGNYRVAKRILPKNFTASSGLGNGTLQILGQDSGRTITGIGTGGNLLGFNQIQAGGYSEDVGNGCYALVNADSSF